MLASRITTQRLAQLCHRTGTQLKAGVDMRRIWTQEAEYGPLGQREHMNRVRREISRGHGVAEALRNSNGYFPPLTCEMVEVGEQTGRLDDVLLQLAQHYTHLLQLRRQFLTGIAWPAIQLVAAILIIGLFIFILGMVNQIRSGAGAEGVSLFGLQGASGAAIFFFLVFLLAGLVTAAVLATARGWFGPLPMMAALRLPMLGSCLKTMALARFSWSLAMALDAGIDARRAMRLAVRSTQNPFYISHQETIDRAIIEGQEFNIALSRTHAFPHDYVDALAAAELSGTHSDSLYRLAHEYDERSQAASRMLTMIASAAIWGLVVVILVMMIAAMVMQFFVPYIDTVNDLSRPGAI